ncbi:hypothetical protein MHY85_03150 [Cellulomonas sp. ACRRI]|uniref:hypothetical protein n=1 Tax=Cellulomonas sp. ACRRI TaxID=2918188 RepID=UPI001EF26A12|nr:hypothetical protein [Cellulomonas sp. ACRRI]MCG7284969.1 hypothetical protein [Cellulomonas sp. ACRRI]
MPRLRNSRTGVVVNVDDDTASRLDKDWKPFEHGTSTPDGSDSHSGEVKAPKGNASREAWFAHATDVLGLDVPEDATQKQIRALVAEAAAESTEDEDDDSDDEGIEDEEAGQ